MAVEINTVPTEEPEEFSSLIAEALDDIRKRFPEQDIDTKSIVNLDPEFIKAQPLEARELGCDPDYDAYRNGQENEIQKEKPIRTAGGHIHIGWGEDININSPHHIKMCCEAARQLDLAIGLWSLDHDVEGMERRKMYGAPGAFRPKSYGIEYRTLSNFWVFDKDLTETVMKRTLAAMDALADDKYMFRDFAQKNNMYSLHPYLGQAIRLGYKESHGIDRYTFDHSNVKWINIWGLPAMIEEVLKPYMEARNAA